MATENTENAQAIFMGDKERLEGKYNAKTLADALGALNQDGLVVLKNVIPVNVVDDLNAWMCQDADNKINDPAQAYNHGVKCTMTPNINVQELMWLKQTFCNGLRSRNPST